LGFRRTREGVPRFGGFGEGVDGRWREFVGFDERKVGVGFAGGENDGRKEVRERKVR